MFFQSFAPICYLYYSEGLYGLARVLSEYNFEASSKFIVPFCTTSYQKNCPIKLMIWSVHASNNVISLKRTACRVNLDTELGLQIAVRQVKVVNWFNTPGREEIITTRKNMFWQINYTFCRWYLHTTIVKKRNQPLVSAPWNILIDVNLSQWEKGILRVWEISN